MRARSGTIRSGSDGRAWKAAEFVGAVRVEGRLPDGLRGVLYRVGPAVHERFGLRATTTGSKATACSRSTVSTTQGFPIVDACWRHRSFERKWRQAGAWFSAFDTRLPDGQPVRRPDDVNTANTAVLDHHGALLVLWEGGSASRIDRDSLTWSGFKSWSEGMQGLPFTAHPKVEADGTVWAFGYLLGRNPRIVLYHIASDGSLVKAATLEVSPLGMAHDFVVTRQHLVLVLPPYVVDLEHDSETLLGAHAWRSELGSRVLVVRKDDFAKRRWYQLPSGFGFHHGNGWEESDGTIRFDHCLADDPSLVRDRFRGFMRGRLEPAAQPRYSRLRLAPDGSATVEAVADLAEFPRIAPHLTGRRNRFVYTVGGDSSGNGYEFHQVVKRDLERGTDERHDYGSGVIAEEHLYVPRPGSTIEDDGWLVGTILDYRRRATALVVLDARRPSDGPLAVAWLDHALPLGFHGWFSPA